MTDYDTALIKHLIWWCEQSEADEITLGALFEHADFHKNDFQSSVLNSSIALSVLVHLNDWEFIRSDYPSIRRPTGIIVIDPTRSIEVPWRNL